MHDHWQGRRVAVTGGHGFLGRRIVALLEGRGADVVTTHSSEHDLRRPDEAARFLRDASPHTVIHAAALVGGIGANLARPGAFFHDNMVMAINVIEQSRLAGVSRVVAVGSACAYPKVVPVPFREETLWDGFPEESNAPYGVAKRATQVMLQAYRAQYGLESAYVLPTNMYGPGDTFDAENSHAIPAMILKMEAAKRDGGPVVLWGDGSPTRDYLYVDDSARGIVAAAELIAEPEPVNLGSGREVSARELAEVIAAATGYTGEIVWDTSKPNGQPRRVLDASRARELLGWEAEVPFDEGVRRTVEWWESQEAPH